MKRSEIRDLIITGTFAIGHTGLKEPPSWENYAIDLEDYIINQQQQVKVEPEVKVQIAEMLKGEIEKVVKHLGVGYVENSNELYNYWNAKLQTLEQIQNWIDSNLSA